MDFHDLIPGTFLQRDNRFRATVLVKGQETWAFVPNTGRMQAILTKGAPAWLQPAGSAERKTAYDLKLIASGGVLVSVYARLPNLLFEEYLARHDVDFLPEGGNFQVRREVTFGESRLDLQIQWGSGVCWVETKSVTLVEDRTARFPDAPTRRGRRHIQTLIKAAGQGMDAAVIFVVQRPDAESFSPHHQVDPQFAELLKEAAGAGVAVRSYTCQVTRAEMNITREIPCILR